jgi:hypothetical protein
MMGEMSSKEACFPSTILGVSSPLASFSYYFWTGGVSFADEDAICV